MGILKKYRLSKASYKDTMRTVIEPIYIEAEECRTGKMGIKYLNCDDLKRRNLSFLL